MQPIGQTAFIMAQWRSEERWQETPLFDDPFSKYFSTTEGLVAARALDEAMSSVKQMFRLRTRYFDDCLKQAVVEGTSQALIFGVGLDMRAERFKDLAVSFFEIDQDFVIEFKNKVLKQHDIQDRAIRLAGDYLDASTFERLQAVGFNPGKKTFILWEGNTPYIAKPKLLDFLKRLKNWHTRFLLAFDYLSESLVARTTGFVELTKVAELFAARGAPFQTGFNELNTLAEVVGLRLVENFTQYQLQLRYEPDRSVQRGPFECYSVCQMTFP